MMVISREIHENVIFNEFRVLMMNPNNFLNRRAFGNTLRKCQELDIDFKPLLAKALNEQNPPPIGELPAVEVGIWSDAQLARDERYCAKCDKIFPKGENGWKGFKRFCKQECSLNDLKKWEEKRTNGGHA